MCDFSFGCVQAKDDDPGSNVRCLYPTLTSINSRDAKMNSAVKLGAEIWSLTLLKLR